MPQQFYRNTIRCFFIFGYLILVCATSAFAQNPSLHADTDVISLHESATIANAGDRIYTINEVISAPSSLKFEGIQAENTNLGFTNSYYWVRLSLRNTGDSHKKYILETARPVTDQVNLYLVDETGGITLKRNGDNLPFWQRSVQYRKPVFEVELPAHKSITMYLQLKSDGEVINMPLLLRSPANFFSIILIEQLVFGFFYGILFIAFVIYLFFFFGLRERSFLYYSAYVICIGFMQLALDGYFHQYITPQAGWFSDRAVIVFASLSTLALGKYGQEFLKIRLYSPLITMLFRGLYFVAAILLIAVLVLPGVLRYSYPIANVLGLIVLILIVASIVAIMRKKGPVDGFFITGIGFLILGFVIFILNNFSVLPNSFLTENSSKFGTGLEVIFLSLSMANLIRKVKDEREEFNRLALERSEEMNDLKSYFLSNISHELRTPLNAIMNLSEALLCDAADSKLRENCQIIRYSSQSLLSSVNDIIDFSKIEKGEIVLEKTDFELPMVLDSLCNNAAYRAKEQSLEFSYTISDKVPAIISGDSVRLAQIINNVLSNAFKFTTSGFVKFTVDAVNQKNGDIQLVFGIADSGIGIPKEKLHCIFDSFSQESINHKRKFGGLGLGLYISKALVDMKHGTIHLYSKVGVGTICTIKLNFPIVRLVKEVIIPPVVPVYDLEGKRILVVEDNAINQMVIKMITKKWENTSATYVNNGQESVDALLAGHYDIVLMDLQMPVMDGYEATIAIRNGDAGEKNRLIPIIAVTADVMETTKARVKEIGMNDYLSKPIKAETLYESIKALL